MPRNILDHGSHHKKATQWDWIETEQMERSMILRLLPPTFDKLFTLQFELHNTRLFWKYVDNSIMFRLCLYFTFHIDSTWNSTLFLFLRRFKAIAVVAND